MKRAIVTGANGFVGAALCQKLLEHGNEVIAIVKNESSDISRLSPLKGNITIYYDNNQLVSLSDKLMGNSIDVFYHLAWAGTSGSLRSDYETQIHNITTACIAVELCNKIKCPRFVYASSIMEYEIQNAFASEKPLSTGSIYSSAKLAGDYIARALANKYGIIYISAFISNIYGPGEYSQRLINTTIRKLLNNEHCSFSPGTQDYDFIYIDDAAKAFVLLGQNGNDNRKYYIGNKKLRPLKDFLLEIKEQIDPQIKLGFGELETTSYTLSLTPEFLNSLYQDTDYVPEYTFGQGIAKTIEWIKETI